MKEALAMLLAGMALSAAAQDGRASAAAAPAAPAAAGRPAAALPPPIATEARPRHREPEVVHTVIEDESIRIDELRVRGVPQRIVVTTSGRAANRYEIITGDGSRDLSDGVNTSRGAAGKRVWRVLDF
jgi:hypothetical protein